MKQAVWVIVPAYNESFYLGRVLEKLKKKWPYFVVVDDGSKDDTLKIAKKHSKYVISHRINLGKGAAMRTGSEFAFKYLDATGVIFLDADDQHDPAMIPNMANLLKTHPVVFGIRAFNNEMPLFRIILNRVASLITLVIFGKYIPDIPCGFKGLRKSAYQTLNLKSHDYSIEMEIAARVAQNKIKYSTITVPTIYHDLNRGMTLLDTLHMISKVLSWRISK